MNNREVQELSKVAAYVRSQTPTSRRRIRKFPVPERTSPTKKAIRKTKRATRPALKRSRSMNATIQEGAAFLDRLARTAAPASPPPSPTGAGSTTNGAGSTTTVPPSPAGAGLFELTARAGETEAEVAVRRMYSTAAFCIDKSGSMGCTVRAGTAGRPAATRFSVVVDHLFEVLEAAGRALHFSVILFDHSVKRWQGGRLVENDAAARAELRAFLAAHGPSGGTDLLAGVEALMAVSDVQERFLLADGDASGRGSAVVAKARAEPVNCVGVGLAVGSSGYKVLEGVAKAAGGVPTFLTDGQMQPRPAC